MIIHTSTVDRFPSHKICSTCDCFLKPSSRRWREAATICLARKGCRRLFLTLSSSEIACKDCTSEERLRNVSLTHQFLPHTSFNARLDFQTVQSSPKQSYRSKTYIASLKIGIRVFKLLFAKCHSLARAELIQQCDLCTVKTMDHSTEITTHLLQNVGGIRNRRSVCASILHVH